MGLKEKMPENEIQDIFLKYRVITYIWVVLFPLYGLYRVWGRESTFRRSEKWVWTMIVILYIVYFIKLIITG